MDVTDEKSVREALDLASELGPITAAVNCAGIATAGLTFSKRGLGRVGVSYFIIISTKLSVLPIWIEI